MYCILINVTVRITGLDPAIPPPLVKINFVPLNRNDAAFVDVIHTDAGFYGSTGSSGTVDFWPNGGVTLQPGCPKRFFRPLTTNGSYCYVIIFFSSLYYNSTLRLCLDLCGHRRSWRFWSESVLNPTARTFHSIKAKNWLNFKLGIVEKGKIANMGIDCDVNIRGGNYFLQTNSRKPFSRGMSGIKYNNNLPIYTEPDTIDT